jgi:transcriptional regulator with XRE-family HTH domain
MPKHVAHPTDQHVGTKLRARRAKLGMSQSTLAEALGLTFQQVQKYEKGANRVSSSRLQQLAQILQMPVEYFFEGLPHERAAIFSCGPIAPPVERLVARVTRTEGTVSSV